VTDVFEALSNALADRYRLERELGAGGMATVYLAEDLKHQRQVAIKVLRPELAESLGAERFLREVPIAAKLNHPHILTLIDSGEAAGFLYYVMPYVEGESLRKRIDREGELPLNEALRILQQVVDALAYAHSHELVHRDMKPDNVMLSGRHALVTDFGIAKAVSAATSESGQLTSAGMALGTPAYMAPEQAAGDPNVDHRADIYAVGVLAYELLAGRPPFEAATAQQVVAAQVAEKPVPVTRHRPTVPAAAANVVMRCLEKRPADRWQSAEELLQALEQLATPAHAVPPPSRVAALFSIAAAAVLLMAFGLVRLLGLPDWLFVGAVVLLGLGFPILLLAGHQERQRAATGPASGAGLTRWLTWRNAIGGGVLAFALWGVVATGWLISGRGGEAARAEVATTDRRSIAVLPFASARTDDESESFTSGVHDDLLTQLSKIGSLKVISRTSVMQYQGTQKTIRQIGEELGVATVLEGRIQRAGDRVRVSAQLIDAKTDEHLWAETYDQALSAANIFAIQSDLAQKIAGALKATLAPRVAAQIEKKPTESLAAYDLYVRGRYLFNNKSTARDALEGAGRLFRQAIEVDSGYAQAYAGLADVYLNLLRNGYLQEAEVLPVVRQAVERALELDPLMAEAHASLGWLLTQELRFEEAEQEFRRALELNPGDASAHDRLGNLLGALDRHDEGIQERRSAVELDPLSVRYRFGLLSALFFAREYETAIEESEKLIQLEPDHPDAFYYLGIANGMSGRHEEAIAAARKAMELNPEDPFFPAGLGWAYALSGQREKALEAIAAAEKLGVPIKEVALVYAALGDLDRAFEYLDRAYEEEPGSLAGINADPSADPLRSDPRFGKLLEKIGLK
jgi:serine/threonine-protein kinase